MQSALYSSNWDVLCIQETHWDVSHVQQVQNMGAGSVFWALGTARSRGVATVVKPCFLGQPSVVHADPEGAFLVLDFSGAVEFRLINVYAPNDDGQRRVFFEKLFRFVTDSTILIGDFNVVLSNDDIGANNTFKNDISRSVIFEGTAKFNLTEVWRALHPSLVDFSRRQVVRGVLKQSRIDLCFASSALMQKVSGALYKWSGLSDHSHLNITFSLVKSKRNGGLWVLNNSILEDETFCRKMNHLFDVFDMELELLDSVVDWWSSAKNRIKKLCIHYSKHRAWQSSMRETTLRQRLWVLDQGATSSVGPVNPEFLAVRAELEQLEVSKCRGAMLRAKARYTVEGERSTAYFFGLEKARQGKLYIDKLSDNTGKIVSEVSEVLDTAQDFYSKLFSSDGVAEQALNQAVGALERTLSREDRELCDAPLSLMEIEDAVKSLNTGKSPGEDGLTCEFFRRFASRLAPILLLLFNDCERECRVGDGFAVSVVTLLFKKGDRSCLTNYRPISLLNVDYKILAKVLAGRLKSVIGSVIHPSQAYSVPGRDISDTVLSLRYVLRQMHATGGIHVSVDFNKAFDRVEHSFLWAVLSKLGFGARFVNWLRLMYSFAVSKVKINGFLTDSFPLKRSVRQGCPLSSLLYTLAAEPLAAMLRRDAAVRGLITPAGREVKIFQYADDTNLVLRDVESLNASLHALNVYGLASGAKINFDKTLVKFCGSVTPVPLPVQFQDAGDSYRVLGVPLGEDEEACRIELWSSLYSKVQARFNLWRLRNLTLKGKVLIVNALCMSMLNHALTVYDLPGVYADKFRVSVNRFLWKRERGLIAHNVLLGEYEQGGLKLVDLGLKKQAFRLKIIRKFLDVEVDAPWKDYIGEFFNGIGKFGVYNLCTLPPVSVLTGLPPFERELLEAWRAFRPLTVAAPDSMAAVAHMPLRHNPDLLSAPPGKRVCMLGGAMEEAGLEMIGKVFDVAGNFSVDYVGQCFRKSGKLFRRKYISGLVSTFNMHLVRHWGSILGRMGSTTGKLNFNVLVSTGRFRLLTDLPTRAFYLLLLSRVLRRPTSEHKWSQTFPARTIATIWAHIYNWYTPHRVSQFDFKFRHRIIFTSAALHAFLPDRFAADCPVCHGPPETLEHMLTTCPAVRPFWSRLQDLLARRLSWDLPLPAALGGGDQEPWLLLFGPKRSRSGANIHLVRLILSIARYSIFIVRNIYLHDNRTAAHWPIFTGLLAAHLRHLHMAAEHQFNTQLVPHNTLITITPSGNLTLNF